MRFQDHRSLVMNFDRTSWGASLGFSSRSPFHSSNRDSKSRLHRVSWNILVITNDIICNRFAMKSCVAKPLQPPESGIRILSSPCWTLAHMGQSNIRILFGEVKVNMSRKEGDQGRKLLLVLVVSTFKSAKSWRPDSET
jgi:hypothetical protein